MNIEIWKAYLDKLETEKQITVVNVLMTARKFIPQAQQVMSYGVPTLKFKGIPILAVAANKNYFSIYPFGGAAIKAVKPLIKNAEWSKGTIRFSYDQLPTERIIKAIVKFKIESMT
jgi:uncharacterized protein YdhG (YjbR/CyaY superfamily)